MDVAVVTSSRHARRFAVANQSSVVARRFR